MRRSARASRWARSPPAAPHNRSGIRPGGSPGAPIREHEVRTLSSYAQGNWVEGKGAPVTLYHAVTGEPVAQASTDGLDFKGMLEFARRTGGPALRVKTFHERARILKALASHLMERKDRFYELSAATGATKTDSWIDIEGGIGTLFVYASRGRRGFPHQPFYLDGEVEPLSKGGSSLGRP